MNKEEFQDQINKAIHLFTDDFFSEPIEQLPFEDREPLDETTANTFMKYKGYIGSVEFSESDDLFYGKVQGIHSLISYEGTNAAELIADFHRAVDSYLELCKTKGTRPEVACKVI